MPDSIASASRRPPAANATKELLIEQLLDVFIVNGFHGATLTELARATGLSKASLYHHFPGGKDEMIATLIRRTVAEAQMLAWRHLQSERSPQQALAAFVDGFETYCKRGERQCLLAVLCQAPLPEPEPGGVDLAGLIHAQMADWRTSLANVFALLGNKPKRAQRLADALMAQMYGALMCTKLHNDARFFTRQMKRVRKSIDNP
jgi:AcrR family transcriptional regulator